MKINKLKTVLLAIIIAFALPSFAQNVDADLLKKAQQLGISEQQIRTEMAKQSKAKKNSYVSNISNPNPYTPRVIDTINIREREVEEEFFLLPEQIDSIKASGIYGQNMFKNKKITYEPSLNIPTPVNYVLSIGDEVIVNVWGDTEFIVKEYISPEGLIYIPNLGPININGMTVSAATKYIENKLSKINQSIGSTSQIMLSIGQIRSIKVNITGEVEVPGTYTVPSLATLFHVLHISGGTTDIGDLRNIEVFRDSKKVADMDIYDFIMNGDISGNIILKDGDVVVVPPYSIKTSISGEIKRPMYYLMKDNESIGSIIKYAGNFRDNAYKNRVKVFRKGGEYNEVITVEKKDFDKILVNNGDSVIVERAKDDFKNIISVNGAVWYPGDFQLNEDTNTLSKLIKYAGGLKGNAFSSSAIIERRNENYTKSIINFNPAEVVAGRGDIILHNYDEILIPVLDSLQEDFTITILGEVNTQDTIVYRKGMRIEDVILLAGGLKESASLSVIEVSRRINDKKSVEYTDKKAEVFSFKINEDLSLMPESKEFTLEPYDIIVVRKSPQYKVQTAITIDGEVIMPGRYILEVEGTYLSDIVKMAKGVTPNAYIKGANLTRTYSDASMNKTAMDLQESMSTAKDSMSINTNDLKTYAVAINLEKALANPGGVDDVLLQEGDIVTVPKFENIVKTIGAVYYPNAAIYSGDKMKKYIQSSGGYTKLARKRPFVVYKNGTVKATRIIFFVKKYPKIEPGCLVVVPMKPHKDNMTFAEILSLATSATSMATSMGTLGVSLSR